MTIEIHEPELETLISKWMESGEFASVEEALCHALLPSAVENGRHPSDAGTGSMPAPTLMGTFERGRDRGEGADLSSDQSGGRPAPTSQYTQLPPANDLDAMFAEIRGLADDLDFSRIPSTERPVDL